MTSKVKQPGPDSCLNPLCPSNKQGFAPPEKWKDKPWYYHHGWYITLSSGVVPRFRCRYCGQSSSTQTTDPSCYKKSPKKQRIDFLRWVGILS